MRTARIKPILAAAIMLLSAAPAWAISEGGAIFLMIRPGARPSGMGSAFCAIADDATATYYNPAGMAFLKRNDPLLNYQDIKDWNRFLNSFKDLPAANVFTEDDLRDTESMLIELSGWPLLCQNDISDWDQLFSVLADTGRPAGKSLFPLLGEEAGAVVTGHKPGQTLDKEARATLIHDLNKLINDRDTYKLSRWHGAGIPEQVSVILSKYKMVPDSLGFTAASITDPQNLLRKIKGQADPVSQYVYGRTTGKAKVFLSRKYNEKYIDSLKTALASALNNACRQPDLYNEKRFKGVTLDSAVLAMAGGKTSEGQLIRFNQALLVQAYAGLLNIQIGEVAQEDMRLLNRKALDELLKGSIVPYGSLPQKDSLIDFLRDKTRETVGQIFLQYNGEGPLAEAETRLLLDEINNNVLNDTQLVRYPAPKGRKASQHLQTLADRGFVADPAMLNRILLGQYLPGWFGPSKILTDPHQYLKSLLSADMLSKLDRNFKGQTLDTEERQQLLTELNQIISRADFYQKELWVNHPITAESQELLAENPGDLGLKDLLKLNRMLLEALYPNEIVNIGQDKRYASLMHSPWLSEIWSDVGDMYYEYIAYVQPYKDWGVFGGSVIFISEGTSRHTGMNSEDYGEFSSYEFSPSLSYGNEIFADLAGGMNLKLIHSHLAPFGAEESQGKGVATTWALDFGLLYKGPFKGLSFGSNLQNIGPKLVYIDAEQADPLSRNLRVGTAYKILDSRWSKLTAAYDITKMLVVYDRSWRVELEETVSHLGFEYSYTGAAALSLRYGLVYDRIGRIGTDDLGNFKLGMASTYGAGVGYKNIVFDFSMEPGGQLQKYNKKFSLSVEL